MNAARIVTAALVAAALAACGGGGDDGAQAEVLVDEMRQYTGGYQAGGNSAGTAILLEVLDGPRYSPRAGSLVMQCATVTWQQRVKKPGQITLRYTPIGPAQLNTRTLPAQSASAVTPAAFAFEVCNSVNTANGGNRTIQERFEVRTDQPGDFTVLETYSATVRWRVTMQ